MWRNLVHRRLVGARFASTKKGPVKAPAKGQAKSFREAAEKVAPRVVPKESIAVANAAPKVAAPKPPAQPSTGTAPSETGMDAGSMAEMRKMMAGKDPMTAMRDPAMMKMAMEMMRKNPGMVAKAQEQMKNNPEMAKQAQSFMQDPGAMANMQKMMDADPGMAKEAQESYAKYGGDKMADVKKAAESDGGGGGDVMAKMQKMMADPEMMKKAMEAMKKPGMVQEAQARLKTDPALQAMVAGNPMLKRAAAMMEDPAAVERAQAQMMGLSPEKMQSAMSAMSAMQAPSTPAASPPPDSVSDGGDEKTSEAEATSGGGFGWGSIKEKAASYLGFSKSAETPTKVASEKSPKKDTTPGSQ